MRMAIALTLGTMLAFGAFAQEAKPTKRYGVEADLETFPQKTPQETLTSILKAIEERRIGYLAAQLAEPSFIDKRVKQAHAGKFDALVQEVTDKMARDPGGVKKLRKFQEEGAWEVNGATAAAKLKGVTEQVYMRKIDNRWFLENRERPDAEDKGK